MTGLLLIKLLRDLRTIWGRIAMMVLAIGLSLVVFSAMLYARSIVESQETIGYASTNPASARLLLDPAVPLDQMEVVRALAQAEPAVIDATMRSVFSLEIADDAAGSAPTQLKFFVAAPDDPMRIARFDVEQGSWPPPPDGLLMERSALAFLRLKVGEQVKLAGADGGPVTLTITGVVHDPSLAPAYTSQAGYGFISTDTLPLLGMQPSLDQLVMTIADQPGQVEPSHDRDSIVRSALNVVDRLKALPGLAVEEVAVPPPYEHPHHPQSSQLLAALVSFGALSLVLSAILSATMFDGLLAQQIPQIGILKAVGASSGRILQLYLLLILLVSGVATALAFVPGILLGEAQARRILSGALNIDITSLAVPWWTYGSVIGLGVGLPLLFALAPLVRASRRTVREALDDRGVDRQGVRTGSFYAWLGKLHGMERALLMAFRNLFRRRARLLLSVGLLATAGAIFVAALNTMAGVQAIPNALVDAHRWDVELKLATPGSAPDLLEAVSGVPGVVTSEAWTTVTTGVQYAGQVNVTRTYPDQGHGSVSLTALPLGTSLFDPPPVLEGRWLRADDIDAIVLPQTLRKTLPGIGVGDAIELPIADVLTTWRVVGIVNERSSATCPCVSIANFEQATGRSRTANLLRIATDRHDLESRVAIGAAAAQALANAGIEVQSVRPFDTMIATTEEHLGTLVGLVLLFASVIGAVGLIGLGSMMSTNVVERTREFGVMSAIGAPAFTVFRLVAFEGLFTAALSCVAAALPALLLTMLMGAGLGNLFMGAPVPLVISPSAIFVWIVIVMLGAGLATLLPAFRATRLTVREALAYL
ncbi:ABC transporter permease [Devosia nitrariae]|uniref:ABC3 transporter permease C-terminal domain-containing protein n=1 Tax=Devosia nitrariae TaxID=2071872 RepID=A0ABQ5W1V6_9HYPH|nr:ABC transporter permease [Devosia nitrariae]GLQ53801.1 hypothetical protein GCM10010862_10600 [Devosia nitrariae]